MPLQRESLAPKPPRIESVPCTGCEVSRKDRQFIKGEPYDLSIVRLLADRTAGGKVLAHAEGIKGAAEILHPDESRYLLTDCAKGRKWLTFRLDEEVYVEKIGIISAEFYASTFRHIQILGSLKFPTSDWRLLGEVETDPSETHEIFNLSSSSRCPKCFVRYIKVRVLSYHKLEGFSKCALTRIQVFGPTMLQSIDRFAGDPPRRQERISEILKGDAVLDLESTVTEEGESDHENPPLFKFINDIADMQKNYAKVSTSIGSLYSSLQAQQREMINMKGSETGLEGEHSRYLLSGLVGGMVLILVSQIVLCLKYREGSGSPKFRTLKTRLRARFRARKAERHSLSVSGEEAIDTSVKINEEMAVGSEDLEELPSEDQLHALFKGSDALEGAKHFKST